LGKDDEQELYRLIYVFICIICIGVYAVAIITVRIDDGLKRRMKEIKHINWSEVIRQAIIRVLTQEETQNIAKAVLINERSIIVPDEGYSSLETIKEWREKVRWVK